MKAGDKMIERFTAAQRVAHWVFAGAFFVLLITGLIFMIPALSGWAAGGTSRTIHRVAAVIFMLVPIYYALAAGSGLKTLIKDSFSYDADDRKWLANVLQYYFGRVKGMPPQGRINAGEKLHHALIIITFFTISISGVVLWLSVETIGPATFALMIIMHDISMFAMVILTIGHIYFTFVYGALNGMISGYVTETYARLEHAKWLAQLQENTQKKGGVGK